MRSAMWAVLAIMVASCGAAQEPAPKLAKVKLVLPGPCTETYQDKPAAARARAALRAEARRFVARQPGRVVYMARDLRTGATVGQGEHEHDMITASGAKVDILTALLDRRHRLSEGEKDLATRMITESDNSAADSLWWKVGGGGGMSRLYGRLGLRETTPGPSKYWGGTRTSPADRIRLMELLVRGGRGLRDGDRAQVLSLMERVQPEQAWGISAAARPGDKVALKNGWTPRPFVRNTWAVTSYGWVHGPGRDLLLAVQTDQQPGHGTGIRAIEGLSRLIGTRVGALDPTRTRPCVKERERLRGPRRS
ncbi:serine hydrolase [Nonomuraea dietziae]|uniref:serine hydrolase n=1 Tax=Nonomuraea dietziae TaxID=65515 RepID=UPI00341B9760